MSTWHIEQGLHPWVARKNSNFSCFMTILVMPQNFKSWKHCHNTLCGWQMSCSQKFGFFRNLDDIHHPQSSQVAHEVILGDSLFITEQTTHALSFWPNPSRLVVHNRHLVPRKETPPKLGYICERYRLLNLAPVFGQHMKLSPKTCNVNLWKNIICLEYEDLVCYFGSHGGGQHPTPLDSFPSMLIAT